MDKVNKWVNNNRLVNWRNEKLGHGVIAFEDDPELQNDICEKINLITDFFRTNLKYFSAVQIYSNNAELSGYQSARNLKSASAPCSIKINDAFFDASPFIMHIDSGIYFYDEIIRKKQMRLLCYPMGKVKLQPNDYTSKLASLRNKEGYLKNSSINSEFLTKAENDYLAKLGCVDTYVEPEYIISWLRSRIQEQSKGVFLLEMERGCGKTLLSEKLNRRFAGPQEIVDNLDVRTYHLYRTQAGGIEEFIAGIESEWNQAFEKDPGSDLVRSVHIEYDPEKEDSNALALVSYLDRIRAYTSKSDSRQRKTAILLVLDGMDEISERNSKIWSFIPKQEQLSDGVYILLTGRNRATDNLPDSYLQRISSMALSPVNIKQISANSKENLQTLRKYIVSKNITNITPEIIEKLLEMSDGKFLSLTMLCNHLIVGGVDDTMKGDIKHISRGYLSMLENRYGDSRKVNFQLILSILAALSHFESLSLQEMADLSFMDDIRFELLDTISDILPLLSVERGYSSESGLQSDDNRYRFVNDDIIQTVEEYLGSVLKQNLTEIFATIKTEIVNLDEDVDKVEYVEGYLALISHCHNVCVLYNMPEKWYSRDLKCFYHYAFDYHKVDEYNAELISIRFYNTLRQIIGISKSLDTKTLDSIHEEIIESCHLLTSHLNEKYLYEEETEVLEFLKRYLESSGKATKEQLLQLYLELGCTYKIQGHPLTDQILKKALSISYPLSKKDRSRFMPTQIHILLELGSYYMNTNRISEAEDKFRSALEDYKKTPLKDPEIKKEIVSIQLSQALIMVRKGKANQAEAQIKKIRDFWGNEKKKNDIKNLSTLAYCDYELGNLLREETKYDEAEPYFQESIQVYEELIENGHVDLEIALANAKHNYAILFREQKKNETAKAYFAQALATFEKYAKISPIVYEVEAADTLMSLGNVSGDTGCYDEAIQYYLRSLDIYKKYNTYNPSNYGIRYADACINYGSLLQKYKGDLINAEIYFSEAEKIYEPLYRTSPGTLGFHYSILISKLATNKILRYGYNNKAAIDHLLKYVQLLSLNNSELRMYESYSIKAIDEDTAKFLIMNNVPDFHFAEKQMTAQNGWNNEVAKDVIELMKTNKKEPSNPYDYLREIRGMWLDHAELRPDLQKIKEEYAEVNKIMESISITNGPPDPVCDKAYSLMMSENYVEANNLIKESVISTHSLSVNSAHTWFCILAASGDLQDADNLVATLSNAVHKGLIVNDDIMNILSALRLIMFVCIEEMMGHDIIDFLSLISGSPRTHKLTKDDLDTKTKQGTYTPIIALIQQTFPGMLEEIVLQFFDQYKSVRKLSPELRTIKKDFKAAFERFKSMEIVSKDTLGEDLLYFAVKQKREGQYILANRNYIKLIDKYGQIYTSFALAWYKTLAVSGDIEDAFTLAQHVFINKRLSDQNVSNLFDHMVRLASCVEGVNGYSPIDYLKVISGNPSKYRLKEKDLDIDCRSGIFNEFLRSIKTDSKEAYDLIIRNLP